MLVGVAIDPSASHDCLTRKGHGLFFWSDRTLKKLEESRGSDSLQRRQVRLVVSMLGLFLNLMLDSDENISEECVLEVFMGSEYNLRK